MLFRNSHHINRVNKHLEAETAMVILHLEGGGNAAFAGSIKADGGALEGTDVDGDLTVIHAEQVTGYTLSHIPVGDEGQESSEEESALADAFFDLRVACEASKDPAVKKALAALVEVEGQSHGEPT